MPEGIVGRPRASLGRLFVPALVVAVLSAGPAFWEAGAAPQGFGGGDDGVPQSAQDAAPTDLTGYWVSVVTEDWIERMSPDSPPSGTGGRFGTGTIELPEPDPGEPCRVYGAGGSMRVPGRLNIAWVDENTLSVEMDAGTQTRLFHFNPSEPPPAGRSLQGYSVASWSTSGGGGRGRGGRGAGPPAWGSLRVVTTNLTSGYLLSSRSLYSEDSVLREEFMPHSDFGDEYFTVRATVQDGASTNTTSSTFKREPDGSRFSPTGCEVLR